MNAKPIPTAVDIEQIIAIIPGVMAVRVGIDIDTVSEVHVLSDTTRHPMQLVRDIESSLMARFGLRIDRRCISVAQLEPKTPESARLALHTVSLSLSGSAAEVRTELLWEDRKVTGIAQGAATSRGRLVLAAEATVNAIAELLPPSVQFIFETLDTLDIAGERSILVLFTFINGQQTQSLAGAAYVRRDDTEAAVRAVLAAVNRRLGLFLNPTA